MKDAKTLYSLLSDILDCDYKRLIDAFDGVDDDVLSEAIIEVRDNGNLSLESIMAEVILYGFYRCDSSFYKECAHKLSELEDGSDEYVVLDSLDVDDIKDSIVYEDGVCWDENSSRYSKEEMVILLTYLSESFEKLTKTIGSIDGLPEIDKNKEEIK